MKAWSVKFYTATPWQDCRESFLQSKQYLCERCSTEDNPIPAKIAHHRIYLTEDNINDPYVSLAWDNLEALCQECHNREHHGGGGPPPRYRFDGEGNIVPAV